jgi:DNA-binding PadR family transcriptional regulator
MEIMMEISPVLDKLTPLTASPPPESIKKKEGKKKKKRPLSNGNGRGIELKPRDIAWLKYLAWGPARYEEAKQFYKKKGTYDPVSHQMLYTRLNKLIKAGFIRRHTYTRLKNSNLYYLGGAGVDELINFGFEADYVRTKTVSATHIVHELLLSNVIRKIFKDSLEKGLYKVLHCYDDRMLKLESKYAKGKIYPDLEMKIKPWEGGIHDFLFEIEGIEIRKSLFIKKLRGLAEISKTLFVVVREQKRVEMLFNYTHAARFKPRDVYFCVFNDFLNGGLYQTQWKNYPTNQMAYIRYK